MAKKADYKSIMGSCCAGLWHYLRALWGYGLCLQVIWNSRVKAAPSAAYSSPSLLLAEAGHRWSPEPLLARLERSSLHVQADAAYPRAWTPLASSISLQRAAWSAEGPQPRDSQPRVVPSTARFAPCRQLRLAAQARDGEQCCVQGQTEENTRTGSHCTDVENQSILYSMDHWFWGEFCSREMNSGKCKTHHPCSNYHSHSKYHPHWGETKAQDGTGQPGDR